jgi:hypothetical protein
MHAVLKFNPAWRFQSPGPIADGVHGDFFELIGKVVAQVDRQKGLEHFKHYFAGAAGMTSNWSSSASWAVSDLHSYMSEAAANAPLFIEAFHDACLAYNAQGIAVPDMALINAVLARNGAGYQINGQELQATSSQLSIAPPERLPSLDEQALEIIQKSLKQSEEYLTAGQIRPAVQEILWLLETVSTLFQDLEVGENTVQAKYFNKIAQELRRHKKGTTLEQALDWATTLHGYLSSPSGGGVRHGANLKTGLTMQPHEARLFCNLIRSYINYLLSEYDQLRKSGTSKDNW